MKKKRTVNIEMFRECLTEKGFTSISAFARACGLDPANVCNSLHGNTGVSMDALFLYANTLHVSIDRMINIFYYDNYMLNKAECVKPVDPEVLKAVNNRQYKGRMTGK